MNIDEMTIDQIRDYIAECAAAKAWWHERMAAKTTITIDPEKVTKESIEALMKDNGVVESFRSVANDPVPDNHIYHTRDDWYIKVSGDGTRIVGDAASVAPVSQTWTLPTDTYPDGTLYGGMCAAVVNTVFVCKGGVADFRTPSGPITDARPSWRPTDVPKAEEVKATYYRIGISDIREAIGCVVELKDAGFSARNLDRLLSRLMTLPEAP